MSESARIAAVDLNGQLRGKRVPAGKLGKPCRMPFSALNVDVFGYDIDDSPLVFKSGDADGVLMPTARDPIPLPWLEQAPQMQISQMEREDGRPFEGDPRRALERVLEGFRARGCTPYCAVELEFFLVELDGALAAPINPSSGRRLTAPQVLGLRHLDGFDAFFNDVERGGAEMGLAPSTITSESGLGQFEVTLDHKPAMAAAEDALLMKELIKGTARKHGLAATFMAKPFAEDAGNGLHMHTSLLVGTGKNVFDDGSDRGTLLLAQAIAGVLSAMPASTAFFAPFAPSFARFVDHAHAPTAATWGYDNRTVAVRVPSSPPQARRFEHRVAGGDVNPCLVFAAILGAALAGIEDQAAPPPPTTGNAYDVPGAARLAPSMEAAVAALKAPELTRIFEPLLLDNYARTKQQDLSKCRSLSESEQLMMLFETV